MKCSPLYFVTLVAVALPGCDGNRPAGSRRAGASESFETHASRLRAMTDLRVLDDVDSGARVAVTPGWQGRIVAAAVRASPDDADDCVDWQEVLHTGFPVTAPGGGEDLPPAGPFEVTAQSESSIQMEKSFSADNGAVRLKMERAVQILGKGPTAQGFEVAVPQAIRTVAFRSTNSLQNTGAAYWPADRIPRAIGLRTLAPSSPGRIWIVPLTAGTDPQVLPRPVGETSPVRIRVTGEILFYQADQPSAITVHLPAGGTHGMAACYDPGEGVLTILRTHPSAGESTGGALLESRLSRGTTVHGGEITLSCVPGDSFGGGESTALDCIGISSAPAPLGPGERRGQTQTTAHFAGTPEQLDPIAITVLGVSLEEIRNAFEDR